MDIPSLFMIPSAVSSGKVHSVFPNSTDADFDFARSSTASRVNSDGLIETVASGQARLNYEIEGGLVNTKPSLLLEPQSTNLITYSEDFTQSSWSKFRVTLTGGFASPDGLNNAYKFVSNTETGTHYIADSTTNSGSASSISFFIKQKGQTIAGVGHGIGGSEIAYFDLANGVTLTKGSSVTSSTMKEYPNGWYKCSITFTSVSNPRYAIVFGTNADNTNSYAGDGVNGILIYGSQYEVLSYATSYIPTNGSAQTRAAETCNGAGTSSIFESTDGVFYAEIAALANDGTSRVISLSDGSNTNRIHLLYFSQNNFISANYRVSGSTQAFVNVDLSNALLFHKIAWHFRSGKFKLFIDGSLAGSNSNTTMLGAGVINELAFNEAPSSTPFYGKIRDIRVYNTKEMTDSEVDILLTKITS